MTYGSWLMAHGSRPMAHSQARYVGPGPGPQGSGAVSAGPRAPGAMRRKQLTINSQCIFKLILNNPFTFTLMPKFPGLLPALLFSREVHLYIL